MGLWNVFCFAMVLLKALDRRCTSESIVRDEDYDDDVEPSESSLSTIDKQRSKDPKMFNFASQAAGAVVLDKSPTTAKGFHNLLNDDRDKYGICACDEKKWVVIGLSEDILVASVEVANYEKYSSMLKDFQILASNTYPTSEWIDLGTYTAEPHLGPQLFAISRHTDAHTRYLKFKFLTHYLNEALCTLSQIKVFGMTVIASFKQEVERSDNQMRDMLSNLNRELELNVDDTASASSILLSAQSDVRVDSNALGTMDNLSSEGSIVMHPLENVAVPFDETVSPLDRPVDTADEIHDNAVVAEITVGSGTTPGCNNIPDPPSTKEAFLTVEEVSAISDPNNAATGSLDVDDIPINHNVTSKFEMEVGEALSLNPPEVLPEISEEVAISGDSYTSQSINSGDCDNGIANQDNNCGFVHSEENQIVPLSTRLVGCELSSTEPHNPPVPTVESDNDPSAESVPSDRVDDLTVCVVNGCCVEATVDSSTAQRSTSSNASAANATEAPSGIEHSIPTAKDAGITTVTAVDNSSGMDSRPGGFEFAQKMKSLLPFELSGIFSSGTIAGVTDNAKISEAIFDKDQNRSSELASSRPSVEPVESLSPNIIIPTASNVDNTKIDIQRLSSIESVGSDADVIKVFPYKTISIPAASGLVIGVEVIASEALGNCTVSLDPSANDSHSRNSSAVALAINTSAINTSTPSSIFASNCLENLSFIDFQKKMIAKLQQKSNSTGIDLSQEGSSHSYSSKDSNVFRSLMQKIKGMEMNQAIVEMYITQMTECLKSSSRELQQKITFQLLNLVCPQGTSAINDRSSSDFAASEHQVLASWLVKLQRIQLVSLFGDLHYELYSAIEQNTVLTILITLYALSVLFIVLSLAVCWRLFMRFVVGKT